MLSNQEFTRRYHLLNEDQKRAVDTLDGSVLVLAGPGAGKTELLSMRVGNILLQTDTPPQSILCLTFTDSACQNMRSRLLHLIGREAYKVNIYTFHSFATEIINRNPEHFYAGANFTPADEISQYTLLENIFKNLAWDSPLNSFHPAQGYTYLSDAKQCISSLKQGGITPIQYKEILDQNKEFLTVANPILSELFTERISGKTVDNLPNYISKLEHVTPQKISSSLDSTPSLQEKIIRDLSQVHTLIQTISDSKKKTVPLSNWKKQNLVLNEEKQPVLKDILNQAKYYAFQEIYAQYQEHMYAHRLFDYDDMLLQVIEVLKKPENLALRYNLQEQYLYVLVDEFQDTNGAQLQLLETVIPSHSASGNPNIMVVGDDDQAIFKFQGANLDNILGFIKDHVHVQIITLTKNYRSVQPILDFAMDIINQDDNRLSNVTGISKQLESMV
jgi:DNA helicase-2/ATP-dependent DNA helicase PcrA